MQVKTLFQTFILLSSLCKKGYALLYESHSSFSLSVPLELDEHIQEKTLIPEIPFLWQPCLRWQDQQDQDSGVEPEDGLVLLHEHPVFKRRRRVREGVWHGAAVALCQVPPCTESSFIS